MTKHVFLSFVEEDLSSVNLFRGQAKNKNFALAFDDYSVKTPYNSTNAAYIRQQITEKIRAASVTICLIGSKTHSSNWVEWEIDKSADLGKKLIGVRLTPNALAPATLSRRGTPIYGWELDRIVAAIG